MITLLYSGYYNTDEELYPFHVDPNFFYLTSCDLPNVLVLKQNKKYYVYVEIPKLRWYDSEYFMKALSHCFHATIVDFETLLQIMQKKNVFFTLPNLKTHPKWNQLQSYKFDMMKLPQTLTTKREIKSVDEVLNISKACSITSQAIKDIIKQAYPNMSQIELSGLFKQSISKHGIQELSFQPITSHGKYNQFLHYIAKNRPVTNGSLVLLDVGCKYNHYCSDISRCFPISGKFTKLQTDMYQVVLQSLKYALTLMKPGAKWSDITKQVHLKLYNECLKLQLVTPLENDSEKQSVIRVFMPHSLGHHVGIDNHDCGPITILKQNMIVAVEPGIYFQKGTQKHPHINQSVWKQYEHIGGVRLEDTIQITKTAYKNLSKITKEIKGIEQLMK